MPAPTKVKQLNELKELLSERSNFVVTTYSGLTVDETSELRGQIREKGARLKVVKNNLFQLALKEGEAYSKLGDSMAPILKGPVAVTFVDEDFPSVSKLLVDYAKTGQRVVRLKSGDGGTFGRLEEETDALTAAGIPFEIIPGVPSACAAAAAAGIPLTRRLTARRVQFITGHDARGALPEGLNMAALADAQATTVVFMGQRTFPDLAQMLITAGLPPDTPALLAEGVSTPQQALHRMTIAELAQKLETSVSDAPALILYGALAPS